MGGDGDVSLNRGTFPVPRVSFSPFQCLNGELEFRIEIQI